MVLRLPDFRTYLFVICMTYLWVMLLFHLDLQNNGGLSQHARTAASQAALENHVHGGIGTPYIYKNISYSVVNSTVKQKPRIKNSNDSIGEHKHHSKIYKDYTSEEDFIKLVGMKIYAFSAYLDHRSNDFDNKENGSLIRIMAVLRIQNIHPKLTCSFRQENGSLVSTAVSYYEMCESHSRPYAGHILSCHVPTSLMKSPHMVILSASGNRSTATKIRVASLRPQKEREQFGLCVPPLFGHIATSKLVEFIELSRILGADRITFYSYKVSDIISDVLRHYQRMGVVSVVPWRYPNKLDLISWYHGQMLAIQDCLYRNMGHVHHLAFNDIDEFIVPRIHENWGDMLDAVFKPGQGAIQIESAFFRPRLSDEDLMTLASVRRTTHLSDTRTKCMVRPELIFELGIHHISKPIRARLTVDRISKDVAIVHHYRRCMRGFGMDCRGEVNDTRLDIYGGKLRHRVSEAIKVLS